MKFLAGVTRSHMKVSGMAFPGLLIPLVLLAACTPQDQGHAAAGPVAAGAQPQTTTPPSSAASATAPARTASAKGVVEAVDPVAGTVTIAHGPVTALQWPAMTMTFDATGTDLSALHPGDTVSFDFTSTGMNGTVNRISRD